MQADCVSKDFGYHTSGASYATDFNALAPDRDDIPELGCMATKKGSNLYLLLINRTSDREINVSIDLGAEPAEDEATLRTLSGEDIDIAGATLTESKVKVSRAFKHKIQPYTAEIIIAKLK